HAVTVVGYGTTEDSTKYWLLKNQWGESCENGYMKFFRNAGQKPCICIIGHLNSYPYQSLDGTSGHEERCLPIAKLTYSRLCPRNLQFPLPLPPQEKPLGMRMPQKVFVALLRKLPINKAF
ncbi:unnamed protein product, partial [Prunus brigantina]